MGTVTVAMIIALGLAAKWVIGALKGGGGGGGGYELASRDAQIQRLREEMDGLHGEVRRLAEEQSFMVRLLAEGGARPAGGALSAPERPDGPNPETT
ncbi:hypothetical protein [Longimicrobium sp.]|uniref:hypothetical protein n=1 Tax=Longimicrobium sp. TaxID=2029185 RepID=UPI003B3A8110